MDKRIKSLVSVVVPTHNSNSTLDRCLSAIIHSSNYKVELIVVDDESTDNTINIAKKHTQNIIIFKQNKGKTKAREAGFKKAKGQIVVNIDSDVVIYKSTLNKIVNFFHKHPNIDAVTGRLSKENPYSDFFSQYKTLYMFYYFSLLPKQVNFLYGSIFGIRKKVFKDLTHNYRSNFAEDTDIGQQLVSQNKKIFLLQSLIVKHLKKYRFISLLKNDFIIPYYWASLFLKYNGWKQLGKNSTGYAHASKEQIISIFIMLGLVFFIFLEEIRAVGLVLLLTFWFLLNYKFFSFLYTNKGFMFSMKAVFFTLLDHLTMTAGIIFGTLDYFFKRTQWSSDQ